MQFLHFKERMSYITATHTSALPHLFSRMTPNLLDIATESPTFALDSLFSYIRCINIPHLI